MMNAVLADFAKWFAKPYDQDMNVGDWFLFLGLVAILSFAWSRILQYMQEELP